jgi:peroxiredoxin
MLLQQPDTIIKYLTRVLDQIPLHTTIYKLYVTNTAAHFEKSNIMGMDKVLNYLVDRYYCSVDKEGFRSATWMDEEKLEELCKDVKTRLKLAVGEIAPNLILPDSTSQKWYNLHQLENDYIILYFWDPGCGHCKKETPKLQKLYAEKLKERGVEVFAIGKAIGDDFKDWKKFVKKNNLSFINIGVTQPVYEEAKKDGLGTLHKYKTTLESLNYQETYDIYSTPRVWILDKDKRIIGKNLGVAQIEDFLDKIQGFPDAPKLFPIEDANQKEK